MFVEAVTAPPAWYFREKGVGDTPACPREEKRESVTLDGFTVTKTVYTVTGGRAVRVSASGAQVAAVVDFITLDESRAVYTPFSLPPWENLNINVVSRDRLVLRADTGAKLFRIASLLDGKPTEGAGLLLPDGFLEGQMRFSYYSGLYGYGRRHVCGYAVCEDTLQDIIYWHIEGEGESVISDATHAPRLTVKIGDDSVTFTTKNETKTFYEK